MPTYSPRNLICADLRLLAALLELHVPDRKAFSRPWLNDLLLPHLIHLSLNEFNELIGADESAWAMASYGINVAELAESGWLFPGKGLPTRAEQVETLQAQMAEAIVDSEETDADSST